MEKKNYTIKDIARMSGVSAGTVDRVLHNRGDVSKSSREKVEKVLESIDYRPNMFAIGLAAKKHFQIVCIIPVYHENDYWHMVTQGIERAALEMQPFNVDVSFINYRHGDKSSYESVCQKLMNGEEKYDAVLIAPNFTEETQELAGYLDQQETPYVFIDFNVTGCQPLSYIGQDSFQSGYIASKILMRSYQPDDELVLILNNQKYNPAEIQMQRRLEGFMTYLSESFDKLTIHELVLDKTDAKANYQLLDAHFANHPKSTLGAVFNSRVYQVASYLCERGHRMNGLLGYDLLQDNIRYLKSDHLNYLIGQRPGMQGYNGIKMLCNHMVFKQPVPGIKYMPIDILIKENIDFYFEIN